MLNNDYERNLDAGFSSGVGGFVDDELRAALSDAQKEDDEVTIHNKTVAAYKKDESERTLEDWRLMYEDAHTMEYQLQAANDELHERRSEIVSFVVAYTESIRDIESRFAVFNVMQSVMRKSGNTQLIQAIDMLNGCFVNPHPMALYAPPSAWLEMTDDAIENDDLPF